jgi:hypothetical protein
MDEFQETDSANRTDETSKRPSDLAETDRIVRKWLVTLAATYRQDLSDGTLFPIWTAALKDLPVASLEPSFAKLIRNFTPTSAAPFPSPGHLRQYVTDAQRTTREGDANEAWDKWLPIVTRYASPDIGYKGPKIPARIDHALRAAGGLDLVASCPTADLVWRKKEFVECFIRDEELPEAHRIAPSVMAALAPVAAAKQIAPPAKPIPARVPTVQAETPLPPKPVAREMSQYEVDQRKETLRRQAEQLKAKGF